MSTNAAWAKHGHCSWHLAQFAHVVLGIQVSQMPNVPRFFERGGPDAKRPKARGFTAMAMPKASLLPNAEIRTLRAAVRECFAEFVVGQRSAVHSSDQQQWQKEYP